MPGRVSAPGKARARLSSYACICCTRWRSWPWPWSCRPGSCTRRSGTGSTSAASASAWDGCRSVSISMATSRSGFTPSRLVRHSLRAPWSKGCAIATPHLRMFLSTTTLTGQQMARSRIQDLDAVFFFPFDLPLFVNRTLRLVRPRLFIMIETEIWPNLLRACKRQGVKTMLVNGRISARSYPRYRLMRRFFRGVLADVDQFCMQSEESARRIIDIGARPGSCRGHRQPEVRFARVARAPSAVAPVACCAISGCRPGVRCSLRPAR